MTTASRITQIHGFGALPKMSVDQYFVRWRGKVSGPFAADLLKAQAQSGQLSKHHSVSADQSNWDPAGSLDWLFASANAAAPEAFSASAIQSDSLTPVSDDQYAPIAQPATPEERWFYSIDGGTEIGPVSFDLLKQLAKSGQLKAGDQVLKEGAREWMDAREVSGFVFARLQKRGSDNLALAANGARPNPNMRFCGACGGSIAKTALACPHCGHADEFLRHAGGPAQRGFHQRENPRPQVQTIEKTSKMWKGMRLIGCGIMFLGPVIAVIGIALFRASQSDAQLQIFLYVAGGMFGLGIVVSSIAKAMAWWHHG